MRPVPGGLEIRELRGTLDSYYDGVRIEVKADDLVVGNVVVLRHEHGEQPIRLIAVQPRVHRIKIVGTDDRGAKWSTSVAYGEMVTFLSPDRETCTGNGEHPGTAPVDTAGSSLPGAPTT